MPEEQASVFAGEKLRDSPIDIIAYFLAGAVRIELTSMVLETTILAVELSS